MKKFIAILSLLFLIAVPALAQETARDETVDVKGIIFGHLKDSYHWHIITIGEKEISLHLPVILYSKVSGWHFFSSRELEHTGSHEGFHITEEGAHAGKLVETLPDGTELKPLDLSLTKIALAVMINSLLLCVIVMCTARWYRRHSATDPAPGGFVGLMEYVIAMIVDDVIKPSVGKDYKRYTPLLLTIFFFILLSNIMGLIPIFPAGANVTGNIAITLTLALVTFFTVNVFGNREYWKEILWPDVPIFLKAPVPLLPFIEIVGIFTKPFALTVRLFANITAGHAIILSLTCVIFITARMGPVIGAPMTVLSVFFMIFMNLLELLVAYIQAYVFTMLSAVFIGLSRPEHQTEKKAKANAMANGRQPTVKVKEIH
ncbi:MAG: F0F1 ATP synthase subunit A [Bacteroidaceae bacterium]|nr:F0F1 ATP synthase subunit A [Bacteroidaceae bacterium]